MTVRVVCSPSLCSSTARLSVPGPVCGLLAGPWDAEAVHGGLLGLLALVLQGFSICSVPAGG